MRALLIVPAGCLAVCLTAIGLARAATPVPDAGTLVATPRFVPAAGPVLAGDDRVAWISRRDDRVLDLWVARIGQAPRRVQRFSGSDDERLSPRRLVASATAIGLELTVTEGARTLTRAYAGPPGEPLRPVRALAVDPDGAPRRAVWVARACASAEIRTTAAPTAAVAHEPSCRLRLRRPVSLRHGRLRFGVSCAGFAVDCRARVTVRAGGRVLARGTARYNHSTPPYAAADLRLGARDLRQLRGTTRPRLVVTARFEPSGPVRRTVRALR